MEESKEMLLRTNLMLRSIEDFKLAKLTTLQLAAQIEQSKNGLGGVWLSSTKLAQFFHIGYHGNYWCRESNMEEVRKKIVNGDGHLVPYMMFYSREKVGEVLMEYISRVEKQYNFKGTLTSVLAEEDIPSNMLRQRGNEEFDVDKLNTVALRVADEWHTSPTMYQIFNLLVRYITMSVNGVLGDFFDMDRWEIGDSGIFLPFDMEKTPATSKQYAYVRDLFPSLKEFGHVILSQRDVLYTDDLADEWKASTMDTEYGLNTPHPIFANSGMRAFSIAVQQYHAYDARVRDKEGALSLIPYFKFMEKYKVISKALNNCGMYVDK